MKSILLLLTVGLLLLTSACDDRGTGKPRIDVVLSTDVVYGNGALCNLNYTDIIVRLTGNPSFVNEVKVLIDYDGDSGFLVGSGSSQFIITDNEGRAEGRFVADEDFVGVALITAKVERFPSVSEKVLIYVRDVPEITHLVADQTSLSPSGSTDFFVRISDRAGKIENKRINFSTTRGILQHTSALTNSEGVVNNFFSADGATGNAVIRATLDLCSNEQRELAITIQ